MTPNEELALRATVEAQGQLIMALTALLLARETFEPSDLQDLVLSAADVIEMQGPVEEAAADQLRHMARHLAPTVMPTIWKSQEPS